MQKVFVTFTMQKIKSRALDQSHESGKFIKNPYDNRISEF